MTKGNNKTTEFSAFFTGQRVVYGGVTWAVGALLFFLIFGIGEERPLWYLIGTYIFEQGAFFAAALLCIKNWSSPQIASGKNVWLGIGLGNFFYGFGSFLFGFWELYWGLNPAVSPGDLFYILFYLLVSWGMILAVIPRKISLAQWQWLTILVIGTLGIAIAVLITITTPAEATTMPIVAQAAPATAPPTSPRTGSPSPIAPTATATPSANPTPATPKPLSPTPAATAQGTPTPKATGTSTPNAAPSAATSTITPSTSPTSPKTTPTTTPTTAPTPKATITPSPTGTSPKYKPKATDEKSDEKTEAKSGYGGEPPQFILDMEKQLEPLSQIVGLVYVVGDVFLLIVATTLLLTFWGGRFAQSWRMVAAASFCMYIADMWFKYADKHIPNYQSGSVLEVFWVFSGVLFGIGAALEYDNSIRTRRGGRKRA